MELLIQKLIIKSKKELIRYRIESLLGLLFLFLYLSTIFYMSFNGFSYVTILLFFFSIPLFTRIIFGKNKEIFNEHLRFKIQEEKKKYSKKCFGGYSQVLEKLIIYFY